MDKRTLFVGTALVLISGILTLIATLGVSGDIRYKGLKINFRYLSEVRRAADFKAIFFQSSYDRTGWFSLDNMVLVPYAWNTRFERIDFDPGMVEPSEEEGVKIEKENMIFSDYQVSGEFIDELSKIPELNYIILTPAIYTGDQNYVQYNLAAFNIENKQLTITDDRLKQFNPCPPAKPDL